MCLLERSLLGGSLLGTQTYLDISPEHIFHASYSIMNLAPDLHPSGLLVLDRKLRSWLTLDLERDDEAKNSILIFSHECGIRWRSLDSAQ